MTRTRLFRLRVSSLLLFLLAPGGGGACVEDAPSGDSPPPAAAPLAPESPPDPTLAMTTGALSSINCAESTATGYRSGSAFAITVVTVDGKPVEKATANAYYVMAQAAAADGITLKVVSGFRTNAEQQYLYNCYVNCSCNSCNQAAPPGYSNHQSGHALDLNTGGWTTAIYNWLSAHGAAYGFSRTVAGEHWHWEWWGGGPGGGPCGPQYPKMSIAVKSLPPSGQAEDFAPEGSSQGLMDLYEGQEFVTEVILRNAADGAQTSPNDSVTVDVWFESPYLTPVSYHIYTDWPKYDLATWQLSVADGYTQNPPKNAPPTHGTYLVEHFAPGEGKKIRFVARANAYSIGKVDHPDVRAWVHHAANYYGEQTGWSDPVEVNHAGGWLRAYKQHDVFARDRWDFDGPSAADTEGWAAQHAVSLATAPADGELVVTLLGDDPHLANSRARFSAASRKAVEVTLTSDGAPRLMELFFTTAADTAWTASKRASFVAPGGGEPAVLSVDLSAHPEWTGTITGLRLDPGPSGTDVVWIDRIRAIAAGTTSGDADGDGFLVAPAGPDCDDAEASVHPGAEEICNGRDDDCDGEADFGLTNACGTCGPAPEEVCNGVDDDCDGETDEGVANRCGGCGNEPKEWCNAVDDDCDGETDEGVLNVCGGCDPVPGEGCQGGEEGCPEQGFSDTTGAVLGAACVAGLGACAGPGTWACAWDGAVVCAADDPRPQNAEVCNGVDDDCDGAVDEGDACALCFPGASGRCALRWVDADCAYGSRTCASNGQWGPCTPAPGCLPAPVGGDDVGSEDADVGSSVDPADAADGAAKVEAEPAPGRRDGGCGGSGGAPGLLGVVAAAALAARRRATRGRADR